MRTIYRTAEATPPLRWVHLDSAVRARLDEAPSTDHGKGPMRRHGVDDLPDTIFAASMSSLLVTLYVSICFHCGGERLTLTLAALPALLGILFRVSRSRLFRTDARVGRVAFSPLTEETVKNRLAVAEPSLSPVERVYVEIVALLARSHSVDWHAVSPGGRLGALGECNSLIAAHRVLTKHRTALAAQGIVIADAEREMRAIKASIEGESDPVVVVSLRQSERLCADRLASLQQATAAAAQAVARLQAIEQALMLLRSALAAAGSASDAESAHSTALSIDRVQALALRLADQARVAEATAAELTRL